MAVQFSLDYLQIFRYLDDANGFKNHSFVLLIVSGEFQGFFVDIIADQIPHDFIEFH